MSFEILRKFSNKEITTEQYIEALKAQPINWKMLDPETGLSFFHLFLKVSQSDPSVVQYVANNIHPPYLMHLAASYGDIDAATYLLKHVPNLLEKSDDAGNTPLILACKNDQRAMVEWLLNNGADPDHANPLTNTNPLCYAIFHEASSVIYMFFERDSTLLERFTDKRGLTPLTYASLNNKITSISVLVKLGADIRQTSKTGAEPIHFAAKRASPEVIRFLHGLDNAVINAATNRKDGDTPLIMACSANTAENAETLLALGADRMLRNEAGQLPLHAAIHHNNFPAAQLFEDQIHLRVEDDLENTPLMLACTTGNTDIVMWLLENGADMHATNADGFSAIHIAAQAGHHDVIKLLLDREPLLLECPTQNKEPETPLMLAAIADKVDVVEELLKHGADIQQRNLYGKNALDLALWYDKSNIQHLLKTGERLPIVIQPADKPIPPLSLVDQMFSACQSSNKNIDDNLHTVIQLLKQDPSLIHATNSNGLTPLQVAHKKIACALIRAGAVTAITEYIKPSVLLELIYQDKTWIDQFVTPANIEGYDKIFARRVGRTGNQELVNKVLDINIDHMDEILIGACKAGKIVIVKLALDRCVQINKIIDNIEDSDGNSLVYIAAEHGHWHIIELLLKYVNDPKNLLNDSMRIASDCYQTIQFFLKQGIDPKYVDDGDEFIQFKPDIKNFENLLLLLKHSPNLADKNLTIYGDKPLNIAYVVGNSRVVKKLIELGAKLNLETGHHLEGSAFRWACTKPLLAINSQSANDLLEWVCQSNDVRSARMLLRFSSNIEEACLEEIFYDVVKHGITGIIRLLLKRYPHLQQATNNDSTPLIFAGAQALTRRPFGVIKNQVDLLREFFIRTNPTLKDKQGNTPLTYALRELDREIIVYFVEKFMAAGYKPDEIFSFGELPENFLKSPKFILDYLPHHYVELTHRKILPKHPIDNVFVSDVIKLEKNSCLSHTDECRDALGRYLSLRHERIDGTSLYIIPQNMLAIEYLKILVAYLCAPTKCVDDQLRQEVYTKLIIFLPFLIQKKYASDTAVSIMHCLLDKQRGLTEEQTNELQSFYSIMQRQHTFGSLLPSLRDLAMHAFLKHVDNPLANIAIDSVEAETIVNAINDSRTTHANIGLGAMENDYLPFFKKCAPTKKRNRETKQGDTQESDAKRRKISVDDEDVMMNGTEEEQTYTLPVKPS